jgi:ABC-type multidrug transport system permease subunit
MKEKKQQPEQGKLIDFYKIWAIIQKNFIVMTRDKTRIIPLFTFPVVMILVFGFISGNIPKHISTTIVDYDNSPYSQEIQQEIANNNVFSIRHVVSVEGEARKLLDSGKTRVIIEIPPNLQKDIDNGIPGSITVIIDESDSSIGSTAKQTISSIVNKLSYQISLQRLKSYQITVGNSASILKKNLGNYQNQYKIIESKSLSIESYLKESKKLTDTLSDSLTATLPQPLSVQISKEHEIKVLNNTYVFEPAAAEPIKAQIAVLDGSSRYVSAAELNNYFIESISKKASMELEQKQDYQVKERNIDKPLNTIFKFSKSNTDYILRPLLYEEKPAYGTGKRPIDFIIPSIIALTIFQGAVMIMGRAVAGEKREGSLTRVFLTPTSNATIVFGTLAFYVLFETFRGSFIILISMLFFQIKIEGNLLLIGMILGIYAAVATSIGMILSSAVKTEQQYMAMAMLVSMPTIFLSGAFFPLQAMPKFMQILAQFLPVTYGADALRGVMIKGFSIEMISFSLFILLIFLLSLLSIVFMVFKRDIE